MIAIFLWFCFADVAIVLRFSTMTLIIRSNFYTALTTNQIYQPKVRVQKRTLDSIFLPILFLIVQSLCFQCLRYVAHIFLKWVKIVG